MIKEFLESDEIAESDGPTERQFQLVDDICKSTEHEKICLLIMECYDPELHSRHQVANLFNMLIWQSSELDLLVSKFFKSQDLTDHEFLGIRISKHLEWFPFETPEQTLKVINSIKNRFPQFQSDFEHWIEQSKNQLK